VRHTLIAALGLGACAGCDIDDRTFSDLALSSRRIESDAGAAPAGETSRTAADAGSTDAGSAGEGALVVEPASPLERPVRALGDTVATPLVGGATGRDDRARCVDGVLIGFDYRFNDGAAASFPERMTFVKPVCAVPVVSGEALELLEPAAFAWSEVAGDVGDVERPVPTHRVRCPDGYAVVGLTGSIDEVLASPQTFAVRELELDCAPLLVSAERAGIALGVVASVAAERFSSAPGSIPIEVACDSGTTVATGAIVRWGSWLDAVGLQCSRLAWPFTGGHGCALNDDCQSGICNSWARCEP